MTGWDAAVRNFVASQPIGVVATMRNDGFVRQSVVYHVVDGDRILMSTLGARAKAKDVERTPRASYCVMGHERPYPTVTIEGPARILRDGIGPITAALFEKIFGNAVELTDEQCAQMDRVVLEVTVERVYSVRYLEGG